MSEIRHVIVVGGGTAGWLSAGLLASDHCAASEAGLRVTLIESPNVPILGVGEGTWPSLRDTLRRIGISETDFIRECNASFKQGSRFDGWKNGRSDDSYFHPFSAPPATEEIDPIALWLAADPSTPFAEAVSPQAVLCREGRAPKQPATPEYAAVLNYGYHLDATAFAQLLKRHCTERLGVRYIERDISKVDRDADGFVTGLVDEVGTAIEGDFFVDCSGGKALLIGGAMGAETTDVSAALFNDRALAVHVPCEKVDAAISSQTIGTAQTAGWIWDIALQTRRGVGYVFSSSHSSEDRARIELADYLKQTPTGAAVDIDSARLIKFQSAYRETPWVKNVVAIGMSSGFVEPLEASAIVMVELSATMVSDTLPATRAQIPLAAKRFNERVSYRWERIVDFLKLHYILSERSETYWSDHRDRDTWSDRLSELVDQWRYEAPSREDFPQAREMFPAASYCFVLYGLGFETTARKTLRTRDDTARASAYVQQQRSMLDRYRAGLPTNRELVDHVHQTGFPAGN